MSVRQSLMACTFGLTPRVFCLRFLTPTGSGVPKIRDQRGGTPSSMGPTWSLGVLVSKPLSLDPAHSQSIRLLPMPLRSSGLSHYFGSWGSNRSIRVFYGVINIGATYLSSDPVFHICTKHIEVDYHFVRERVSQKLLHIKFTSSKDQLADIFAKPLSLPLFDACRRNLRVLDNM
jgi:hypothetical protein